MTFFEDIARSLDSNGIESRVHEDTMFVPITSDLEIHFVEIDPFLPAANVYIAAADVDEEDEEFEATLVSVVFSAEAAVATVESYVATDQVVTVLRDLLEGTDERIADLEFFQDEIDPQLVVADVGYNSELHVYVDVIDKVPTAVVSFVALSRTGSLDDELDFVVDELWESDGEAQLSEEDRERLFEGIRAHYAETTEVLELGSFTDVDRLFDVLSLAADQAEDWEAQLSTPYEDFDEDDFDEDFQEEDVED